MSSEASSKPSAKNLPSLFRLIAQSLSIYRRHSGLLVGYAAWLLLPVAAHIVIRTTFGSTTTAAILDLIASGFLLVLTIGAYNVITLYTPLLATPSQGSNADCSSDYEHLRERSLQMLMPVFIGMALVSLATTLGLVALVIPALVLAVWFAFVPQVILFDNVRAVTALAVSKRLVAGRFGAVFARVIGFEVLLLVVYAGLYFSVLLLSQQSLTIDTLLAPLPLPAEALFSAFEAALLPFIAIFHTLLYLALKNE